MKAYILKIVGAALVGTFAEYIVPSDWKKYVKLVSGILMLAVLIIPLKIDTTAIFEETFPAEDYTEEGEKVLYDGIKEELQKNVAADIAERIETEFSKKVTAEVEINTTDDGKIESVKSIELYGKEDDEITERLKYVYGTDAVIWIKE